MHQQRHTREWMPRPGHARPMRSIHSDVIRRGGVAATFELLRDGHTSHQLTRAVRRGEVIRARQGHYVVPTLDSSEVEAVRVGGRLTGLAGARRHGVWTPLRIPLHVAVPAHARELRAPTDARRRLRDLIRPAVRVTWEPARTTGTRSLVGLRGCIAEVARRESSEIAFAVIESALHLRKLGRHEWASTQALLPYRVRRALRSVSSRSESGGESLARCWMLRSGIHHAQQVSIPGVGRVDFVVGDRLVIEVDGAQFHTTRAQFEEDRRRDAELSRLGYRVLRFSYTQVADAPHVVIAAILSAMSRGDHQV